MPYANLDTKNYHYAMVFKDLLDIPLFKGKYDAAHGNKHFMYGIATVMEAIACRISSDIYDEFVNTFTNNMVKSEEEAYGRKNENSKL